MADVAVGFDRSQRINQATSLALGNNLLVLGLKLFPLQVTNPPMTPMGMHTELHDCSEVLRYR